MSLVLPVTTAILLTLFSPPAKIGIDNFSAFAHVLKIQINKRYYNRRYSGIPSRLPPSYL